MEINSRRGVDLSSVGKVSNIHHRLSSYLCKALVAGAVSLRNLRKTQKAADEHKVRARFALCAIHGALFLGKIEVMGNTSEEPDFTGWTMVARCGYNGCGAVLRSRCGCESCLNQCRISEALRIVSPCARPVPLAR